MNSHTYTYFFMYVLYLLVYLDSVWIKSSNLAFWEVFKYCWIGKDSDAGRDWGQEGKGMTEDEMAGWPHWLDGWEFEWTPGVGDEQGGQACCDSWGRSQTRLSDWTELILNKEFELLMNNLPKQHQTQMNSRVNSTKRWGKRLYPFSLVFFRRQKQKQCCLTYSTTALP